MKFPWSSVLQQSYESDGDWPSGVGEVDTGSKPSKGAQVKSLGIERLLKLRQDLGEVCAMEMNESKPLLLGVEREKMMRKATP